MRLRYWSAAEALPSSGSWRTIHSAKLRSQDALGIHRCVRATHLLEVFQALGNASEEMSASIVHLKPKLHLCPALPERQISCQIGIRSYLCFDKSAKLPFEPLQDRGWVDVPRGVAAVPLNLVRLQESRPVLHSSNIRHHKLDQNRYSDVALLPKRCTMQSVERR